jgi:hypothetical protein
VIGVLVVTGLVATESVGRRVRIGVIKVGKLSAVSSGVKLDGRCWVDSAIDESPEFENPL